MNIELAWTKEGKEKNQGYLYRIPVIDGDHGHHMQIRGIYNIIML